MGGQGSTKSFSFSFGGDPSMGGNPFGFGFGDMFADLFSGGMKGGKQHGGFSTTGGPKSGFTPSESSIQEINSQYFKKQIKDKMLNWILLFHTPSAKGYHLSESIVEDVASSLKGAVKVSQFVFCSCSSALLQFLITRNNGLCLCNGCTFGWLLEKLDTKQQ